MIYAFWSLFQMNLLPMHWLLAAIAVAAIIYLRLLAAVSEAASPLGQLHQALLYHRAVCLSAVDRALQRPYQPLVQCDFRSQRRNSDGNDTGTQ